MEDNSKIASRYNVQEVVSVSAILGSEDSKKQIINFQTSQNMKLCLDEKRRISYKEIFKLLNDNQNVLSCTIAGSIENLDLDSISDIDIIVILDSNRHKLEKIKMI